MFMLQFLMPFQTHSKVELPQRPISTHQQHSNAHVVIDESLTYHHPKSRVHRSAHSWYCTFLGFSSSVMTCTHHFSTAQFIGCCKVLRPYLLIPLSSHLWRPLIFHSLCNFLFQNVTGEIIYYRVFSGLIIYLMCIFKVVFYSFYQQY